MMETLPGKVNPADIASRGATSTDSGALQTWLNGPQWMLKDIESEGVEGKNNEECPEECITELKANDRKHFRTLVHSYAPK